MVAEQSGTIVLVEDDPGHARLIERHARQDLDDCEHDYAGEDVAQHHGGADGGDRRTAADEHTGADDAANRDHGQVARAKGLEEKVVIFKHALRNSLIPQVTLLADILPGLIGGSVIIETIFSIPGLGQLGFESVLARDYPTVLALFTVSAVLTLIGILLSDLLLAVVDPRIAFGRRQQ